MSNLVIYNVPRSNRKKSYLRFFFFGWTNKLKEAPEANILSEFVDPFFMLFYSWQIARSSGSIVMLKLEES